MGLNCRINRNERGEIYKVERPDGQSSKLYEDALRETGNREQALMVWATAYTPEFLSHFGYWTDKVYSRGMDLPGGEPSLESVMAFMRRKTCLLGDMTSREVADAEELARDTGHTTISSLTAKARTAFVVNGRVTLNEATLRDSGLYTESEVIELLSDSRALSEAERAYETLLTSESELADNSLSAYLGETERPQYGVIPTDISTGEKTVYGKDRLVPPAELESVIDKTVSGITSRAEFNAAINSLAETYPGFVERYENDADMANALFEEYSKRSRVRTAVNDGGTYRPVISKTFPFIRMFARRDSSNISKTRSLISNILSIPESEFDSKRMNRLLRDLEKRAMRSGIDIVGLADKHSRGNLTYDQLENLAAALDIHMAGISRYSMEYSGDLSAAIDAIFGENSADVTRRLPDNARAGMVFYIETSESNAAMFRNHGLLNIGNNFYMRVSNSQSKESLYSSVAEIMKLVPTRFSVKAFPSSVFTNKGVDISRLKNMDTGEIVESLRRYVLTLTDTENSEEEILTRMAAGLNPTVHENPWTDFFRALGEYYKNGARPVGPVDMNELYQIYLSNKAENTELYKRALKYLDFRPDGSLTLTVEDQSIARQIGLMVEGKARDILMRYAESSMDTRFNGMFYYQDRSDGFIGDDFYHYMYKRNPSLVSEAKKINVSEREDGYTHIVGEYAPFVKVRGEVLSKITEDSTGSLYRNLNGSEASVLFEATQVAHPEGISEDGPAGNQISDSMRIGKESESIDKEILC